MTPSFHEESIDRSMTRTILSILLLLAASSGSAVASLQGEAEQAIRIHGIDLEDVGIAVVDPSSGRMLVDINASTARIPAGATEYWTLCVKSRSWPLAKTPVT